MWYDMMWGRTIHTSHDQGLTAFRRHLPKEQQLPMSPLQRQLLEGEVAYPEGWPERGEDYSHINATEWRMLQASQQQAAARSSRAKGS